MTDKLEKNICFICDANLVELKDNSLVCPNCMARKTNEEINKGNYPNEDGFTGWYGVPTKPETWIPVDEL